MGKFSLFSFKLKFETENCLVEWTLWTVAYLLFGTVGILICLKISLFETSDKMQFPLDTAEEKKMERKNY